MVHACRTTKIYCRPGCPPGRWMKPENGVTFRSKEVAREAGYRACKVCRPDDGTYGPWKSSAERARETA